MEYTVYIVMAGLMALANPESKDPMVLIMNVPTEMNDSIGGKIPKHTPEVVFRSGGKLQPPEPIAYRDIIIEGVTGATNISKITKRKIASLTEITGNKNLSVDPTCTGDSPYERCLRSPNVPKIAGRVRLGKGDFYAIDAIDPYKKNFGHAVLNIPMHYKNLATNNKSLHSGTASTAFLFDPPDIKDPRILIENGKITIGTNSGQGILLEAEPDKVCRELADGASNPGCRVVWIMNLPPNVGGLPKPGHVDNHFELFYELVDPDSNLSKTDWYVPVITRVDQTNDGELPILSLEGNSYRLAFFTPPGSRCPDTSIP